MCAYKLIILSYHQFFEEENEYAFSRTFKQFRNDLSTKDFDWITIDDGHIGQIKACKMMQDSNVRAKLFIAPDLIGTSDQYCTWEDIWRLSRYHDIENHSLSHKKLTELKEEEIYHEICEANYQIKHYIGRQPRYFVPPWNQSNEMIEQIAKDFNLTLVHGRTDIKNDSR